MILGTLRSLQRRRTATILDRRRIREGYEEVRAALARRGDAEALGLLEEVASLDGEWRASQARADDLRSDLNTYSKTFGILRGQAARGGLETEAILAAPGVAALLEGVGVDLDRQPEQLIDSLQNTLRGLSDVVDVAEQEAGEADWALHQRLQYLPNLPA